MKSDLFALLKETHSSLSPFIETATEDELEKVLNEWASSQPLLYEVAREQRIIKFDPDDSSADCYARILLHLTPRFKPYG